MFGLWFDLPPPSPPTPVPQHLVSWRRYSSSNILYRILHTVGKRIFFVRSNQQKHQLFKMIFNTVFSSRFGPSRLGVHQRRESDRGRVQRARYVWRGQRHLRGPRRSVGHVHARPAGHSNNTVEGAEEAVSQLRKSDQKMFGRRQILDVYVGQSSPALR